MADQSKPAFPVPDVVKGTVKLTSEFTGMTLRDYFAAQAMMGLVTSEAFARDEKHVAAVAYKFADAMLVHREHG
jgi:hypothetical protein